MAGPFAILSVRRRMRRTAWLPSRAATRSGANACAAWTTPIRFTRRTRSQSPGSRFQNGKPNLPEPTPAATTRWRQGPSEARTASADFLYGGIVRGVQGLSEGGDPYFRPTAPHSPRFRARGPAWQPGSLPRRTPPRSRVLCPVSPYHHTTSRQFHIHIVSMPPSPGSSRCSLAQPHPLHPADAWLRRKPPAKADPWQQWRRSPEGARDTTCRRWSCGCQDAILRTASRKP